MRVHGFSIFTGFPQAALTFINQQAVFWPASVGLTNVGTGFGFLKGWPGIFTCQSGTRPWRGAGIQR